MSQIQISAKAAYIHFLELPLRKAGIHFSLLFAIARYGENAVLWYTSSRDRRWETILP